MDCNKDEAIRAKEIAENKLLETDIAAARKFASKAQSLFPGLNGLSELLEVINVYVAAEKKVNSEADWYAVLAVDPFADDETIRKQYRRLALTLHPDKNKSVGAEGAFKILSQAWSKLSDKAWRTEYQQKVNLRPTYLNEKEKSSMSGFEYGFHACTKLHKSTSVKQQSSSNFQPPPCPSKTRVDNNSSSARNGQSSNHHWPTQAAHRRSKPNINNSSFMANDQKNFTSHRRAQTPPRPSKRKTDNNSSSSRGRKNFTNRQHSSAENRKNSSNCQTASVPSCPVKPNTFWTMCNRCMMQFEYLHVYLNQRLLCQYCRQPFLAVECPALPRGAHDMYNSSPPEWKSAYATSMKTEGSAFDCPIKSMNMQQGIFSTSGCFRSGLASATSSAETPHMVQPAQENLRVGHEETASEEDLQRKSNAFEKTGLPVGSNAGSDSVKGDKPTKKRRGDEHLRSNKKTKMVNIMAMGNGAGGQGVISGCQGGSVGATKVGTPGSHKPKSVRDLLQAEIRTMLMAKARKEICAKLIEWSMNDMSNDSHKRNSRDMENQTPKTDVKSLRKVGNMNGVQVDAKSPFYSQMSSPSTCIADFSAENTMVISVPDSDFHDFDKGRAENLFGENQVWAAYDDHDGMPRYYALVQGVISRRPFKLRISWLNSKNNSELGPLNWVGSGFPKTSGEFWIGKHKVTTKLTSFSHRVKWAKGAKGVIQIFPKNGDVWALYRNWSPDWNENTAAQVTYQYDMVKVLEDFSREQGVTVAPLVKLAGFKSVFHQHLDPKEIQVIPREEIFRFSHQVPVCLLTGQEAPNAPKGCLELDPGAMPLDLLQVITEAKDVDTAEDAGKAEASVRLDDDRKANEELHSAENPSTANDKEEVGDDDKIAGPEANGKESI